jgi:hypothetical protein
MKTLLIQSSPKGKTSNSSSEILARAFLGGMNDPCDIRYLAGEDLDVLARESEAYDAILFLLPLYIHAMPGIMMRFLSILPPSCTKERSIGFIIQAGFIETEQEKFVTQYFEAFAARFGYHYLGTVSKGEAAGICMFPKMFRKVIDTFSELGRAYEETGAFDRNIVDKLSKPCRLSKSQLFLLRTFTRLGLNDIGWHNIQKKNGVYENRLDRPYLSYPPLTRD